MALQLKMARVIVFTGRIDAMSRFWPPWDASRCRIACASAAVIGIEARSRRAFARSLGTSLTERPNA